MSTFVYGKAHKLVEPAWYLRLDGRKEQDIVVNICRDNCMRFARDPHRGEVSVISAIVSMQVAMEVDFGLCRMGFYVNKNGGVCPKLVEVLKTIEADTWPDFARITITRWPNCKHYYARVDGIDVVLEGQNRWNTEAQAQRMAEKFMANMDVINKRVE